MAKLIENNKRSIVKALSYRVVGTFITLGVAWAITGKIKFAATICVADTFIKIWGYYAHERVWNRISYGQSSPPEYDI